jgi:hypothetical protein
MLDLVRRVVALRKGRGGPSEERELAVDDDVVAHLDTPGAQVAHEIRVRPRVDQHQQRAAPAEVALERLVFDVEQRARGAGRDHDVGVLGDLAVGRQQQLLHPVVLVAQRLGGALVALLRGAGLTLDGPLVVAFEEVDLLLAGARQLHHRVGDVLLGDLGYPHRLFAESHPHQALAELLRGDAVSA